MHTLFAAVLLAAAVSSPIPSAAVTVHIKNDMFNPMSVTVHAGDRVAFVNDDDDAHTVTADDGSWDSEGMAQGDHWSRVFDKTGRVTYHCTVHPFMHGTIVVTSAP